MTFRAVVSGLALVLWTGSAFLHGQAGASTSVRSLAPKPVLQHVSVDMTTSATSVARGGRVTLYADVTPKAAMHVYAEGATDFTPVTLTLTPKTGVTALAPKYPEPEKVLSVGALVPVPAYRSTFRIAQPVAVSSGFAPGDVVLVGVLNYQACDDRICYPAAALPLRWTLTVR